jgi:hypothetical protein
MKKSKKLSIQDKFDIATVGQLVILMSSEGKFINVWHVDNLSRCKPGELDIFSK